MRKRRLLRGIAAGALAAICICCGTAPKEDPAMPTGAPAATGATASLQRGENPGGYYYFLDDLSGTPSPAGKSPIVPAAGDLTIRGWAIDPIAKTAAKGVDAVIDDIPYLAQYGITRADVAEAYHDQSYKNCGFQLSVPARGFRRGPHTLAIRIIASDGRHYWQMAPVPFSIQ